MSRDQSKRYWLKFYDRFFDKHEIKILLDQDRDYVFFYMFLLLESVSHEGIVRYNEHRAYCANEFAHLCHIPAQKIPECIEKLKDAGLLEVMDDGTIYLPAAPAMCGCGSDSTIRMRKLRESRKNGKIAQHGANGDAECSHKCVTVTDVTGNIRDKSLENTHTSACAPACVHERVPPTLDQVLMIAAERFNNPDSQPIPAEFVREWYDLMTVGGWKDTTGKSVLINWRLKLAYAWRDRKKAIAKEKAAATERKTAAGSYTGGVFAEQTANKIGLED